MAEARITTQTRSLGAAKVIIATLFFAWLVDYADRVVLTVALPFIGRDYSLNHSQRGLIITAFAIGYAVFQLPGGFISDRFGARRTMVAAMSSWTAFTALTAIAPTFVSLLAVRFLFGISEGVFPSAAFKTLSQNTDPKNRMTANSLVVCSSNFGHALSPLLAAPLIALAGWKFTFVILAAIGVLIVPIIARVIPKDHIKLSAEVLQKKSPISEVLRNRTVWCACLCFCGYDLIEYSLSSWTPSYLIEVKKLNIVLSGALLSISSFLCIVPIILGGVIFDRFGYKRPQLIIVPAAIASGVGLFFMAQSASVTGFLVYQVIASVVLSFSAMPIFGVCLRTLRPEITGMGYSVINFGGQIAGAIAPFAMGFLVDHFGYDVAFCFPIMGAAIMVASILFLPREDMGIRATRMQA
jgi:MFS family permease